MRYRKNNKRKRICCALAAGFLACALALGGAAQTASAKSLWSESNWSLFADNKARDVGDILTVIISETTTTTTTKSRSNSKSGSTTLNAGTGIFHFLAAASASGSDEFEASGAASDVNRVAGRITVTVTDVLPNGNLVIEGDQSIWQNRDEHKITFNGIIRRDDIRYDNTIRSNQVANATVRFDGKGPLNAKQRQGILTQIFNILF